MARWWPAWGPRALCSTAFASPAKAKPYNLNVGTAATKGKANAKGTVTFPAPKRFKVTGTINDLCPKDGYGAYIEFKSTSPAAATRTTSARTRPAARTRRPATRSRTLQALGQERRRDVDRDRRGHRAIGDAARKLIKR